MILTTGATGAVGRPLTDTLRAEGAEVRAVTRNPRTAAPPDGAGGVRGMAEHGLPRPFVEPLTAGYAAHRRQARYPVTDEVEKLLGRPARTYAERVAHHAAVFQA